MPRAPLAHPEAEPMVWAIDEWHSPLYYFPPDCPRAAFWPLPTTSGEDLDHYWHDLGTRMVVAIESAWLPRLAEAKLFRYELPVETFIDCEDHGVWISRVAVMPLSVEPLGDPVGALAEAQVELRSVRSLVPLAERLMKTSFHWSLIRMRNAVGWSRAPGSPTVPRG